MFRPELIRINELIKTARSTVSKTQIFFGGASRKFLKM